MKSSIPSEWWSAHSTVQPKKTLIRCVLFPLYWFFFFCVGSVLGLTITSTGPSSIEKAGGETINFDCRFTLAPEDTGPLDIEWTLLASDNQNRDQMVSGL